jgi:hypothetical protein
VIPIRRVPRRSSLLALSVALTFVGVADAVARDAFDPSRSVPHSTEPGGTVATAASAVGTAHAVARPAMPIILDHGGDRAAGNRPFGAAGKRVVDVDRRTTAAAVGPVPGSKPAAPAAAAAPRWKGSFNLYRKTAFVTQTDFTWCVAASVQMMVNLVRHHRDRSTTTQQRMIRYAQASDHGPWGPGGGTDVAGWINALRHFGAGRYRAVGTRSSGAALRVAATAMRQTGRPAGMLVMDGRHAWVLHGFESRTDPRHNRHAKITSVRVSGPLYPIQQKHGYDMRPNTELSVRSLARFFTPSSVGTLAGRYVVVVPVH